ncbi:MAG: integration host factor, actinobacterial type [Actinomycetota bacterium]|nr:integration host factor, actinobacterial type [Actinomycetota bacterium]
MPTPPQLSPEQRAAALEKAAQARRVRAEVREALRTGQMSLTDVLARSEEDMIAGMKVRALLTALPGLGKVKSYRLMERLGIAENRRVRGLGVQQRKALLEDLAAR